MRFLRAFLWLLGAVALATGAGYLIANDALVDRLTGLMVALQLSFPQAISLDRLLVILVVVCLLALLALFVVGAVLLSRQAAHARAQVAQAEIVRREMNHVKEDQHRAIEQLLQIGKTLTRRLDKRVLVQAIVESASRLTSVPQANSIVSCWMVNFETDTIRFEKGLYCDETMFTQTEFQPTEPPFSRVNATQQAWSSPAWNQGLAMVRPEKASQLGASTAVLVVPLIVEASVLGFLVVFCHPDFLKGYDAQELFYDAVWGELALAVAIAVQGEVAILDRLTGVHNREYFMKRLVQELERANRYQLPLSLLMVDIDNFKLVNDMLGHPQGDAVLKIIAKVIKKSVRPIDLIGRYGGEEFVIMLPETGYGDDATSTSGAPVVAERIRKAIDEEFQGLQKPLNLTVSIGVALRRFPEDRDADYQDLIRLADEQLYRAKASGKNKVCILVHGKPQTVS